MGRRRHSARRAPRQRARGYLSVHDRGFGFVKTPEGDFFIPPWALGCAFDGDLVEVTPTRRRGSRDDSRQGQTKAARVTGVIQRFRTHVTGRVELAEPFAVVAPLDPRLTHDVFTLRADAPDVPEGALVRVRITAYPTERTAACGVIEEVLEHCDDEDAELLIERFGLARSFPPEALAEAEALEVDVEAALAAGYRDLRGRAIITIDPTDARDFDDGLSIEELKENPFGARFRLGVAIADVSAYVAPGTALDREARRRATSVYLADRVVPMLPERLSCDLCSLNPGVDRLAFVADLYLDDAYRPVHNAFYPAVIRSQARFTYDRVLELLNGAEPEAAEAPFLASLRGLNDAAQALEKARVARGALEFRTVETHVKLAEDGSVEAVGLREKTPATALVESAMIAANEAVAAALETSGGPGLYRVHEQPDAEALAALAPAFAEFSWFDEAAAHGLVSGEPHRLQQILNASAGTPEELLVNSLLLRAQKRARYLPENLGHYGLGAKSYVHFTSPIRRYPDVVVHRLLKAHLGVAPFTIGQAALATIAEHSSAQERAADDAARASQEMKIVEYMADQVGELFAAHVSGVTASGLFVRIANGAEGFIDEARLPDGPYAFQSDVHRLKSLSGRRVFRLGQRLTVKLVEADRVRVRLVFSLV